MVAIIRTDGGPEFQGLFQYRCLKHQINRELTPLQSTQFIGCAERGLATIEAVSRAARIQGTHIFDYDRLPEKTGYLRGEAFNLAWHSLNLTATNANPEMRSPYEMRHGQTPTPWARSFLQPIAHDTKRSRKSEEYGRLGHFLGLAPSCPSGTCRVRNLALG